MIWRSYWRPTAACLISAIAAGIFSALMMAEIGRLLGEEIDRNVGNLREIIVPIVDQLPDDGAYANFRLILTMPELKGIEAYSSQGRRIWHAGESLEIVGYRLGEQAVLSHATKDAARYEVFWSAQALHADYGVALRLDTRWQDPILQRMTGLTISASFILVLCGIVISAVVLERKIMTKAPAE